MHVNVLMVLSLVCLTSLGGFAVVYRARSSGGHIYALKRMAVNNEQDLYLAKQEIAITVSNKIATNSSFRSCDHL